MQIKSKTLIAGAIFTLIALTTMQGYLIFNTYDLRKNSFAVESRMTIGSIVQNPYVDSISWAYRTEFVDKIPEYRKGQINKEALIQTLKNAANESNKGFLDYFKEGAEHFGLHKNVLFKRSASLILFTYENGEKETILAENEDPDLFLLGTDFPVDEGYLINAWNWSFDKGFTNASGNLETVVITYRASLYMKIIDWDSIMLKKLLLLLFVAFLLFVFIITLVSYSIRNLLKIKRISEIKTDFINNITHELKTPLATLSIATKTLTNKYAKDDKTISDEAIATINRQNKRLQNLIDQVVDNSLGYNHINLHLEPVLLSEFIDEVCDDFSLTLPQRIQLLRVIEPSDTPILIDKFFISTAIINVLNNAVKFEGTVLKVELKTIKAYSVITISDNGIGISKKNKKLIFDKFYRLSEKNKHDYKGLGLGLYYCSQIIKAHHGIIDVESKEKQGSTFFLKIPTNHGKENLTG